MQRLSAGGMLARLVASLALVLSTYNPSGHSFIGWVAGQFPHIQPLQAVCAVALVGLWLFFLHATLQSLGAIGVFLGLAFCATVIWLISSWGWMSLSDHAALAWAILGVIACMLAFGLCWGSIRSRVSGQSIVEEVRR